MFEQELTYQKLQIPSLEIYEAMGYKDSMPDGMVIEEINTLLDRTTPLLRPRFFFFIADGPANYGVRKLLPFLPQLPELNLRSSNISSSKRMTW